MSESTRSGGSHRFNYNSYATKKTIGLGLLDLSVMMNNAIMIKNMLQRPQNKRKGEEIFYWPLLAMLGASLLLQLILGILLAWLGRKNIKDKQHQRSANIANNVASIMAAIIVFLNVGISVFEMGEFNDDGSSSSSSSSSLNPADVNSN